MAYLIKLNPVPTRGADAPTAVLGRVLLRMVVVLPSTAWLGVRIQYRLVLLPVPSLRCGRLWLCVVTGNLLTGTT